MFNTPQSLLDKIRLGEDSLLELKSVRFRGKKIAGPSRDELANELAAFANANGGVLVLGVDDKTREGVPIIMRETRRLSGAPATYALIDNTELLLTLPSGKLPPDAPADAATE